MYALRAETAALLSLVVFSLTAAAQTWTGGGADNNWTTAGNWFGNLVPTNDGTANVAFGGTARLTPNVDTNNPWSIQSLTFNSSAGVFVFGGNTLSIGNTANGVGGITNNSANAELFDDNISTAVSQTWTAVSGHLGFAGTVTISGSNVLTVSGSRNTNFSGAVTGNSLVTGSLGSVTLGGSTDNTGLSVTATSSLTILNKASSSTVHAVNGSLTLNGGAVLLEGTGGDQINNSATVTINSGTLDLFGNSETIGALNGSGGLVNNSQPSSCTLTVNQGGTYAGVIQNPVGGAVSLTVLGSTPLVLTGANVYTGVTTINGGATLQLGDGTSSNGSIVTSVMDSGTLVFANPNSQTYAGTISGSGGITKIGAGTLTLPQPNSYSGATEIINGTVVIPSNGQLNSIGEIDIGMSGVSGDNGTLTIDGSGSLTQAAGFFNVGASGGSFGTLNIGTTTNGATATTSSNGIYVGPTGTINIGFGAVTGTLTSNGFVYVNGGVLQTANSGSALVLPPGNSLFVDSGGRATFAGDYTTNNASLGVSGTGSKLQFLGGNGVGVVNGATIKVLKGGQMTATGELDVGTGLQNSSGTGINGTVLVDASGSKLSAAKMTVGARGYTGIVTFQNSSAGTFTSDVSLGDSTAVGFGIGNMSVLSGSTVALGNLSLLVEDSFYEFFSGQSAMLNVDGAGSAVTLNPGASFSIGQTSSNSAVLIVSNNGTFTVGAGGTTTLYPSGTININGGIVDLKSLSFNGGTINFSSGSLSLTGNYNIGVGGPVGQNLTLDPSKILTITGTTTIDQFNTLSLSGGTLSTGALTVNGTFAFNSGTLNITGASGLTIGSSGPFGSTYELGSGRTLNVTNATTVNSGALLVIDSGASYTSGSLVNNGEVDLSGLTAIAGGGSVSNSGLIRGEGQFTSSVTNNAVGEIRAEAGKRIKLSGPNGANAGRVNLQGGTAEFAEPLTNTANGLIDGRGTLITGGTGLLNQANIALSSGITDVFGKVNNSTGSATKGITVSGNADVTFWNDVTNGSGSLFKVSSGSSATFFGTFGGAGITGGGEVNFEADVTPGFSPAAITFGGNVMFDSTSTLHIDIGGTTPGNSPNNHDQVNIVGVAALGGTLDLVPFNGFVPASNDKFVVMTYSSENGTFAALTGTSPAPGLTYNAVYLPTSLVILTTASGEKTWAVDSDGNSSLGINWIGGVAPGGIGDTATFWTIITAPRTVTLGADTTVGTLNFDSPNSYTIAGTHTLTLQAAGSTTATVSVSGVHGNGAHTVSAPLTLASNLNVIQNSTGIFTISGPLNDAAGKQINVSGTATTAMTGSLTLGNGTAVFVSGSSTLRLAMTSAAAVGSGITTTVSSGATLELAGTVSALANGPNRVNITNNSHAPGILVTGTNQQVGNIDGSGTTQVNAGSDLTANHIIQSALAIGGTAKNPGLVTIDASDVLGNPLGESNPSSLSALDLVWPIGVDEPGRDAGAGSPAIGSSSDTAGSMGFSQQPEAINGLGAAVPEPNALGVLLPASIVLLVVQLARLARTGTNRPLPRSLIASSFRERID
jgi:autotransporter-associated beta strand protein